MQQDPHIRPEVSCCSHNNRSSHCSRSHCSRNHCSRISCNRHKWVGLIILLLLMVTCFIAIPEAQAGVGLQGSIQLTDIIGAYQYNISLLYTKIQSYATNILFALVGISMVLSGINLMFIAHGTIQTFALTVVRLCLVAGIFHFLIIHGYNIASDIINSLSSMAYNSGSSGNNYQDIALILNDFFQLLVDYSDLLSNSNIVFFMFFMVALFTIIALLIINFAVTYVVAAFVSVVGILVVGLGTFESTREFALNYLRMVIAYGLRLFSICFIFRVGHNIAHQLITYLTQCVNQGGEISLQDAGYTMLIMLFVLILSYTIPSIIASLVYTHASIPTRRQLISSV